MLDTHTHTYIYIYIYIYVCVCVCVGAPQYTMLIFGSLSSGVSQNKEGYNVTVFNRYDSFITTMYLYYYNTISDT